MSYSTKEVGSKYDVTYKCYITHNNTIISPIHDIPLKNDDGTYNCVNEIPRFENAKFEISKSDDFNPIKQDIKNKNVRFVKNLYPFKGFQANYGAFPQTYEDPTKIDKYCNANGDNDPLDLIDISNKVKIVGEVYACKVIGCLGMIDGNEADWKILVIDIRDQLASKINSISDVHKYCPTLLNNLYIWFKDYKKPDGKQENTFAFNGEWKDVDFATTIIDNAHLSYKNIISNNKIKSLNLKSNKYGDSLELTETIEIEQGKPEECDQYFYS